MSASAFRVINRRSNFAFNLMSMVMIVARSWSLRKGLFGRICLETKKHLMDDQVAVIPLRPHAQCSMLCFVRGRLTVAKRSEL